MINFTPLQTGLGGLLLHLSSSSILADTGRVFGISGITDGAILGAGEGWRWATVAGLISGPFVARAVGLGHYLVDQGTSSWATLSLSRLALAGLLVGYGTKLGSGCTSGHMLCGVSRLSPRSLIATITFFSAAVATANIFPIPIPFIQSPNTTPSDLVTIYGSIILFLYLTHRAIRYTLRNASNPKYGKLLPYFFAGITFSLGLSISGMVSPIKVISFLRIIPPWTVFDPSLAMIMITGLLPNALHYFGFVKGNEEGGEQPTYSWEKWQVPTNRNIDWRLVSGSAIFGIGWGLSGICPGPAIVSLGQILANALGRNVLPEMTGWLAFALPVIGGMRLARMVQ